MSVTGVQLACRWVEEIMTAGKFDVIEEVVAVDFVEHAMATHGATVPRRVHGPAHTREFVGMLRDQFPDLQLTIESIIQDGDTVAVRVIASGTRSRVGGAPTSGHSFRALEHHRFTVVDGLLAEHWAVRDNLTAAPQVGISTAPAGP